MSSPPIPKLLRESSDLTITSASTPSTTTSTTTIIPTNNVTYTRAHRKPSTKLTTLLNPFRKCTPRQKQKSRRKHNYNFQLSHQPLFRNSLLAGVGFLELANAADFAANVWNQIPVPKYAMVFMAIGGPIALLITLVAARDFYLSYTNVQLLLKERRYLRELLDSITTTTTTTNTTTQNTTPNPTTTTTTQAELLLRSRLSVNFRELGTEIVDRILMDALMGFGALLVGTGTIMAIFGANHHVYVASNLLSGYIGNGLAAVFGLVNAIWSGYLVGRFQVCWRSCQNITNTSTSTFTSTTREGNGNNNNNPNPGDEEDTCIEEVRMYHHPLKLRFRSLQFHALVNGINGLVAGAASMVTATMWYGYVVLVPCIVSLIACNWFWRVRVGYDRPLLSSSTTSASLLSTTGGRGGGGTATPTTTTTTNANGGGGIGNEKNDLLLDLSSATHLHRMLASSTKDSGIQLPRHILNRTNPSSVMSFLTRNGMFEGFCVWIDHDKSLERGVEDLLDLESITSTSASSPGGKNTANNNNNNEKPNEENNTVDEEVELSLTADDFLTLARHDSDILLRKMNEYLDGNVVRAVAYRERFLLEVLGVVVYLESGPKDGGEVERKRRWWFGCL
ncbi:hypothetical protein AtubIFM54640_007736 [Aspergillus tubingensis]|uniref:Integral membrane protein n=1 Tax=Aspergillus niger TaxID=5061 RepID=A0A117E3P1_ASPNG|nr:uncharacterized protein AtWU_08404 [Aspergillus tubingensis]GAQ47377.1 integral membrane protein [Aspergillus niger]GFN18601.1 integral membrane protein [Aspergillus tubingensis]GLA65553.1 hypothetical protein AtubIFM54640_007736 [Aspergillus tubingensis]